MAKRTQTWAAGAIRVQAALGCALLGALAGCCPSPEAPPVEKEPRLILPGFHKAVGGIAYSPDGTRLAAGEYLGEKITVYAAASGKELYSIRKPGSGAVAFSPDGRRLATCTLEQQIYDAATGKPALTLDWGRVPGGSVVAFSPDGRYLAFGGGRNEPGKPYVRREERGEIIATDVTAVTRGIVQVFNAQTGKRLLDFDAYQGGSVRGIALSPDGKRLATIGPDHLVKLWDTETGNELLALRAGTGTLLGLAYGPDGSQLAAAGAEFPYAGPPIDTRRGPPPREGFEGLARVQVWSPVSGQEAFRLPGDPRMVRCLAYSSGGRFLASGGDDGTVKVWDAKAHKLAVTLGGDGHIVWSVAFSADGKSVASGAGDTDGPGEVRVWDVARYTGLGRKGTP